MERILATKFAFQQEFKESLIANSISIGICPHLVGQASVFYLARFFLENDFDRPNSLLFTVFRHVEPQKRKTTFLKIVSSIWPILERMLSTAPAHRYLQLFGTFDLSQTPLLEKSYDTPFLAPVFFLFENGFDKGGSPPGRVQIEETRFEYLL